MIHDGDLVEEKKEGDQLVSIFTLRKRGGENKRRAATRIQFLEGGEEEDCCLPDFVLT